MKKRILYVLLCAPLLTFGGNPPPPGLEDPPLAAPIDQMVYVLLTAGFLFGIYIIKKRKKKDSKIFK